MPQARLFEDPPTRSESVNAGRKLSADIQSLDYERFHLRVLLTDREVLEIAAGQLPETVLAQLQEQIAHSRESCREMGLDWLAELEKA